MSIIWLIFCSYAIISYHDVANALIPEKNVKVNVISNFENHHFRSDRPTLFEHIRKHCPLCTSFQTSKIVIFSWIAPTFLKKFLTNCRAQSGNFSHTSLILHDFLFEILNNLARAARKIFEYCIDFSWFFVRNT